MAENNKTKVSEGIQEELNEAIKFLSAHNPEQAEDINLFKSLKAAFERNDTDSVFKLLLSSERFSNILENEKGYTRELAEFIKITEGYLLDDNNPVNRYATTIGRERRIEELKNEYAAATPQDLLEALSELTVEYEILAASYTEERNGSHYLYQSFMSRKRGEEESSVTRSLGRKKSFKGNHDCLWAVKKRLEMDLKGPLTREDLPRFKALLEEFFPDPPFTPVPRLTAAEKKLPRAVQALRLEEKSRSGWAPSTVSTWWKENWDKTRC